MARRHRQQVFERHRAFARLQSGGEGAAVHHLVHMAVEPERRPGVHRGADRRPVRLLPAERSVWSLSREKPWKYSSSRKPAVAGDQEGVDLRRVGLVHLHVDDRLDQALHRRPIDPFGRRGSR